MLKEGVFNHRQLFQDLFLLKNFNELLSPGRFQI